MNKYVKVEDVFRILDLVITDESIKHTGKAIRKRLKELPREDVEKVVRCKDCKFYQRCESSLLGEVYVCTNQGDMRVQKEPADFCSWGVRKEGAEE